MEFLIGDPAALVRTLVVGLLAYAALVVMVRVSGKRTLSQLNAFDLIVTVALGSTLATILLSNDTSLAQGLVAFAILAVAQLAITWGSLRSERLARAVKSEPTALVYRGRILREQMDRERVLEIGAAGRPARERRRRSVGRRPRRPRDLGSTSRSSRLPADGDPPGAGDGGARHRPVPGGGTIRGRRATAPSVAVVRIGARPRDADPGRAAAWSSAMTSLTSTPSRRMNDVR